MTRSPKEVIEAILANLEMAKAVCGQVIDSHYTGQAHRQFTAGRLEQLKDDIALIKVEAADILKGNE